MRGRTGKRRPRSLLISSLAVLTVCGLSACSEEPMGDDPEFERSSGSEEASAGESSVGTDPSSSAAGCSFEEQPAAAAMTSENDVEISWPDSGNPANTYTLGEVDTSTYSCEGLSWVSDDSGWVKDASSGSGAGRTVAFFIDGQQVPQPVAVARISEVSRVDQNTVEINYTVKDSHADPGEKNIVEFSVDDGELSVGDTGDMEKAVLWNTDIAYNEGDGSTSTQASSSAEIDPMREVEPSGEVELSDMISMETSNGDEIRCTLKSIAECSRSGRQGLWNVDGKDVNYVDMKTGEGNMSDLGQGWQRSAVRLEKGERLEVKWSGGGTFIAWDGENVIRDAIAPYGDAIILTPDGLVTVPQ